MAKTSKTEEQPRKSLTLNDYIRLSDERQDLVVESTLRSWAEALKKRVAALRGKRCHARPDLSSLRAEPILS